MMGLGIQFVRQNIVIIDAWTIVDCRNVSRWGREHVSIRKPSRKQENEKKETSRNFIRTVERTEVHIQNKPEERN
jgi:hypothetical protein